MEEVGKAFGSEFSPYITELCPYLLIVIQNDMTRADAEGARGERRLTVKALSCVRTISPCLGEHMHMVLPPVLSVLDDRHAADSVREAALDTLILLASLHPVHERAPSIMQTW